MAYRLVVSPSAQKDIENAFDYYSEVSTQTPLRFINAIEKAYHTLEINPYFRILYKNFRAIPLKKFPFVLVYIVNDDEIIIKACFHTAKSTKKYPNKFY